ncbi:exonuclease domain-containing protein [Rathayibacter iranicus]|uniref:DNA polymerase III subunit epsilon n=2 Tax=Rathayibacter iranicus TaxID=59737 RepID=A0AAD1ENA5_9MICO|nr:exonuclease domain-containing protein [Rathayibacter iranicus]AZZ57057.1 DNA polymerase III subunit epsilon [Rathayibacter iranicus]MWV29677.1 DNA polymerase III subunit epsilon [Rathayibacter iranicus NCPPB 2253 = VKM Ac-1602]PPI41834.1 DNA polymerase III subunit epsilon [Rathayibacter iranicus]PPI57724.1 DNA polymerase III subunit epsilon [Rathayibacter iranicus]PPI68526.1 DNA polymerase III subunit epsilon [Rathayibacter iranicus]
MTGPGFVVIDFETTGVRPERGDRIIEVAVVHLDAEGRFEAAFETLLNPDRDLGAQAIHGISAREILDAPSFAAIAADLLAHLDGRVVVAHNASFERRFLAAELTRLGVQTTLTSEMVLCTMQLAREFLPGGGRSLASCCEMFDIPLENAHRAVIDAKATGRLLAEYIAVSGGRDRWDAHLKEALAYGWPPVPRRRTLWMPRPDSVPAPASFLDRVVQRMPDHSGPAEHTEYLALLDRCLLDRVLSAHEEQELVSTADALGIGRAVVRVLHDRYFDDLTAIAWSDGVLADDELMDLAMVADLLGIDHERLVAATEPRNAVDRPEPVVDRFSLNAGDLVVLTGEMGRTRQEWTTILMEHGVIAHPGVTRKVKLVVAADPDSLSGKARKARDYGITVVNEDGLIALLGL